MRESDFLRWVTDAARGAADAHVVVGPGDDCAVVAPPAGTHLLMTVDHVIEGRHVPRLGAPPGADELERMARKAMARSVSDLAAMAGEPLAALATAALPPGFALEHAQVLSEALQRWGRAWSCPVVGGDLAGFSREHAGPVTLTVTCVGTCAPGRAVLRSGARAGDAVFVTGALGGSLASGRHASFTPRVAEARWLRARFGVGELTSMMDVSDGLGIDAGRVGVASGVRVVIDAGALPVHAGVRDWRQAMGEGEDYELVFTLSPAAAAALPGACPETGVAFTRVGEVEGLAPAATQGGTPGSWAVLADGSRVETTGLGWDHA